VAQTGKSYFLNYFLVLEPAIKKISQHISQVLISYQPCLISDKPFSPVGRIIQMRASQIKSTLKEVLCLSEESKCECERDSNVEEMGSLSQDAKEVLSNLINKVLSSAAKETPCGEPAVLLDDLENKINSMGESLGREYELALTKNNATKALMLHAQMEVLSSLMGSLNNGEFEIYYFDEEEDCEEEDCEECGPCDDCNSEPDCPDSEYNEDPEEEI